MLIIAVSGAYLYLSPQLPSVNRLNDIKLQVPLRIYSSDNKLIAQFGDKRRTPIDFKDIPPDLIHAFLAAEDSHFYSHHGISITGLLRAIVQMATGSDVQTGGSTITMQVAKNYFLSPERNIIRKVREIFLALQIEQELDKQQILELYVNKIFLGHHAYGIVAAAQVYYGKSIQELDLAQFATIAGTPKAPSSFNPVADPARAKIRRDWILSRMLKLGFIDNARYQEAVQQPITASLHKVPIDLHAPYIAEMARQKAIELYGDSAYVDGLSIYTTINGTLQQTAEQAIKTGLNAYDKRHGFRTPYHPSGFDIKNPEPTFNRIANVGTYQGAIAIQIDGQSLTALLRDGRKVPVEWSSVEQWPKYINEDLFDKKPNKVSDILEIGDVIYLQETADGKWLLEQLPKAEAALVSINPNNGAILSLVGGYDFYKSQFNRAIQADRQLGSVFKPFLYAAALANGFTAASIINDAPIVFDSAELESVWRPRNAGSFSGPTRLRKALYLSKNLVSIRILRQIGINTAINYVQAFGFDGKKLPRNLSLALGSSALSPLKLTEAYAIFANGGYQIKPFLIDHIVDNEGKTIYQAKPAIVCQDCPTTAIASPPTSADAAPNSEENPQPLLAPRVIDQDIAFLIDSILKDTVQKGTARRARVLNRHDIAGKTGTTNGPTDVWFAGYHPNIVTVTWVGMDDNSKLGSHEYGSTTALPIWIDFMQQALKNQPVIEREPPANIVSVLIDKTTGKRVKPGASDSMLEYIQADQLDTLESSNESSNKPAVNIEDIFQ